MRLRPLYPTYVIYGLAFAPLIFALYVLLLWLLKDQLALLPRIIWLRSPAGPEYRIFIVAGGLTLTYFGSIWYRIQKMKETIGLPSLILILFITVLCSMLLWFSLLGITGSVLNRVLDGSDPKVIETDVFSSGLESAWPRGSFCLVSVRSWRPGESAELIRAPEAELGSVSAGDRVRVLTKQGFLGIPWISEISEVGR